MEKSISIIICASQNYSAILRSWKSWVAHNGCTAPYVVIRRVCVVEQQGLTAVGTNYPEELFDPKVSDKAWYHDAIYKQQNYMLQKQAEKKEAAKLAKQSVVTKVIGNMLLWYGTILSEW